MQRKIHRRVIVPGRTFVIAEAGSNHGGDYSAAIRLTEAAAKSGADAIKWQLFKWDDISQVGPLMDPRFELPPEWIPKLMRLAHAFKLAFLCTPFAPWAVDVLDPHVDAWKLGSFEIGHRELWKAVRAAQRDRLILASLGRVGDAQLGPLFRAHTRDRVIFLHCVAQYPTPAGALGLNRLRRLLHRRTIMGYSSHSDHWADVIAAVAMGVVVVEKHLRLNVNVQPESPDNADHALVPLDFTAMCRDIRMVNRGMTGRFLLPEPSYGRIEHGVDP